jgi:hypothetical protein
MLSSATTLTFPHYGKTKQVIPQGSILHPLLFLLYTTDLPKIINNKSKTISFADDKEQCKVNREFHNINTGVLKTSGP